MTAPLGNGPIVKGWCPGAYRPMESGDGLVVRVRPWLGELSAAQARVLCRISQRFGTGALELTSRANVQIRGVSDHDAVIEALLAADLLDKDPAVEGRRNLIMTPDWQAGDTTHQLALALMGALAQLPDLPAKFGYAIDTGRAPWVRNAPADLRFELDGEGALILVADGAIAGRRITADTAIEALQELLAWFIGTGGRDAGRMARHLKTTPLPPEWTQTARRSGATPAQCDRGTLLGAPFGQIDTATFAGFLDSYDTPAIRILPGRTVLALGAKQPIPQGLTRADDPLLNVHACTGAPGCSQAFGATRDLAVSLASSVAPGQTLHISGCTKGCAHPRAANHTFVATNDGFDLVSQGAPWDAPILRGLTKDAILADPAFKDIQT